MPQLTAFIAVLIAHCDVASSRFEKLERAEDGGICIIHSSDGLSS